MMLDTVKFDYKLHGHTLERVKEAKNLGVTFKQDLRLSTHINNMTAKANRTFGFLRLNLQVESPQLKTIAYKALIRPLMEYAPTVWDPHTQKEKQQLEKVQNRYVMNRHRNRSSPTEMLQDLEWLSLEERRRLQNLTMLYKIDNGLVAIDGQCYLTPAETTYSSPRSHTKTDVVPHSKTDYHENSFFVRTVRDWNGLPNSTVTAPTVNAFRARLMRHTSAELY